MHGINRSAGTLVETRLVADPEIDDRFNIADCDVVITTQSGVAVGRGSQQASEAEDMGARQRTWEQAPTAILLAQGGVTRGGE